MINSKIKRVDKDRPRTELRIEISCTSVLVKFPDLPHISEVGNYWSKDSKVVKEYRAGLDHGFKDIKLSMNGPLHLTYDEWRDFVQLIEDNYMFLRGKSISKLV